jgi:sugar lactone lactonase YvrE
MAHSSRKLRVVAEGLAFGEGPRWHDGRLWLSDMHARRVVAVDERGRMIRHRV